MNRYPLSLPARLKQEAEQWAARQGVSLNQFILWAVAEKVGALGQELDDPRFAHVAYRRGAGGRPTPVVRGTGIRVQTLAVEAGRSGAAVTEIAAEYGLPLAQVREALAFYDAHRAEVDAAVEEERVAEADRER